MKGIVFAKAGAVCLSLAMAFNVMAAADSTKDLSSKAQTATYNVQEPKLKEDFSNVVNFKQFSGFTQKQLQMLRQNGFVVMEQNSEYPYLKMYQAYEEAEYSETPMFITTDAVLNLYHIFFDDSLKALEASQLQAELQELSTLMLKDSLSLYNNEDSSSQKQQIKTIAAYYAVACLLEGEEVNAPEEIKSLAEAEVKLINQASGHDTSPILGKTMDYSQYTVRGHYDSSVLLGKYFKTMMWYGQAGFELTKDNGEVNLENARLTAMMSMLLINNDRAVKLWHKIYETTSAYTGAADDITLTHFEKLIGEVYGKNAELKRVAQSQYDEKLVAAVKALPEPQITAQISYTPNTLKGKQFRVMGQRYTIDAEVMQQLLKPKERPESSGLDVMAALGSERAEVLAKKYENPNNWSEYESKLKEAEEKCKLIPESTWKSNMYNGWLWTIQSAMKSFEGAAGMPAFMQSKAWTDKSLVTALGSFAELKHDTVLYNKQAGAERGGPDSNMPYIYVEPNAEVYEKLLDLVTSTRMTLEGIGSLNEEMNNVLQQMQTYIAAMHSCALKELRNESFTEEEYWKLMAFGGMVDSVSNTLLNMNLSYDGETTTTYTSALISDVSTILDTNEYVEIGTGIPYSIYVICPYKGKLFLAEGTVFSYYEFTSSERLSDAKWHEMLGIKKRVDGEYGYEMITVDSSADSYKQYAPQWNGTYFSSEPNGVKKTGVEVVWDKSMRPNNPQPGADGLYE